MCDDFKIAFSRFVEETDFVVEREKWLDPDLSQSPFQLMR